MSTSYHRWIVAFACGWVNLFIFATFRSAGVLYLDIIDTFKCTYQQAAWPLSITGSIASTTGILAGFMAHYFAIRWLVIFGALLTATSLMATYLADTIQLVTLFVGLLQGIGIGFVTNLLPAILNAHFSEKKSIALGISYAGATLGAFVFPVMIHSMLNKFAFHNTMLLMGAVTLNAVAGGLLLRKPSTDTITPKNDRFSSSNSSANSPTTPATSEPLPLIEECDTVVFLDSNKLYENIPMRGTHLVSNEKRQFLGSSPSNKPNSSQSLRLSKLISNFKRDLALLSNVHFCICTFTYISFILDFVAFIIILPDVAKEQNIEDVDSKWLLSIFSITDFFGRITPGWFSYWGLVTDKSIYIGSITVIGCCMLALIYATSWFHFVLLSLIYGFATGCQMVLSPAILADYLGAENTAVSFGMSNFICGIVTLIVRPLIIGVKDSSGNYILLGFSLAGTALLSSISWLAEIIFTSFNRHNSMKRTKTTDIVKVVDSGQSVLHDSHVHCSTEM